MSKLPKEFEIRHAENGGFVVTSAYDSTLGARTMGAFTSPVDLIGWLSRNLMPDAAATLSGPLTGEAKLETVLGADHSVFEAICKHGCVVRNRLESAVLMKPTIQPQQRASAADLDQADRFPRAVQSRRPVPPPEGGVS
jgi:hypothetical protein